MYYYLGAGVMPEVPGVPMRDLTKKEFDSFAARLGERALAGVYDKDVPKAAPAKTKKAEPEG